MFVNQYLVNNFIKFYLKLVTHRLYIGNGYKVINKTKIKNLVFI